ncbi:MAG: UDP-N-acetyl-D-glucosamine dehydrogenase [Gemmatales bacterium]|nr:MAG: UDP-N-acetyl-D-glucosamine dehydrogenase [Gemmatales bacterium]
MSVVAHQGQHNPDFERTLVSLKTRQAGVAVIGLGYVGLPLVRTICRAGFSVTGFDCDPAKVAKLNAGRSYIKHIASEDLRELVQEKRFRATTDIADLREARAIIICVPTPLNEHHEPDLSYVEGTAREIGRILNPGQLVVLESTTYPGTLREVVKPILDESRLVAGQQYFLAYSPEREDPGNPLHSAAYIPKVVGGLDPKSHALAVALYEPLVPRVVSVSSPEVAEACKILENTYRCVNIALVNELKMLFERMGIDVWEVIEAAATKPFGFQAFYPGPGLGGHCIPIDPFYLSWIARRHNFHTRFIELAGEINTNMPEYVVQRVLLALNSMGKSCQGSRIGILGIAYKKNVDDARESPSLELLQRLKELGAVISYNDPYLPRLPKTRKHCFDLASQPLTAEYLSSLDCVLIATDHSDYDWEFIVRHSSLVVDTRNATRDVASGREKIWKA